MTASRRRPADPVVSVLVILAALLAVGCSPTTPPTPAASGPSAADPSRSSPDLTPVPGGASRPPTPFASIRIGPDEPDTTDVEGFGSIRDQLPASFPRLDGQEPADDGSGPTSGVFAVNATAEAAAATMAGRLQQAGWTVDVGSPLEDGTVVLEASGPAAACRAEVRFTPKTGSIVMSVLYGASCPVS